MIIEASTKHAEILSDIGAETFYQAHKDSAPAHEIATYMKKVYSLDSIVKELNNPVNIYHLITIDNAVAGVFEN